MLYRKRRRCKGKAFDRFAIARNAHPRDDRISFDETTHTYTLDGTFRFPVSVSGVWARYFSRFDPNETVGKYYDRWATSPSAKYFTIINDGRTVGKSDEEPW